MAQNTAVAPCNCVAGGVIHVKSAGQNKNIAPVVTNLPFKDRENGAKFQDSAYGKGLRLHNVRRAKGKEIGLCCTVCGKQSLK